MSFKLALIQTDLQWQAPAHNRAHLAGIGCPIVGDLRYGVSKASRLALHAHKLILRHPESGRQIEILSPVPPQFKKMLKTR